MSREIYRKDRRYKGGGHFTAYGKLMVIGWVAVIVLIPLTHGIILTAIPLWVGWKVFRRRKKLPAAEYKATITTGAPGELNTRHIPQDVKIAVSVRDNGRCVQCGSTEEIQYDHKIPYTKGGSNTVNNIQLLCGLCNRRKSNRH